MSEQTFKGAIGDKIKGAAKSSGIFLLKSAIGGAFWVAAATQTDWDEKLLKKPTDYAIGLAGDGLNAVKNNIPVLGKK